jgi:hypothetical protein
MVVNTYSCIAIIDFVMEKGKENKTIFVMLIHMRSATLSLLPICLLSRITTQLTLGG